MTIDALFAQERTLCRVGASSRKRILQEISNSLASDNIPADALFDGLMGRERLGSTGLGEGVAVPHCRAAVPNILICLATTLTPIDHEASDGELVDIFVALVVPNEEHEAHLNALSQVTRVLASAPNRAALRACDSAKVLHSCICGLLSQ